MEGVLVVVENLGISLICRELNFTFKQILWKKIYLLYWAATKSLSNLILLIRICLMYCCTSHKQKQYASFTALDLVHLSGCSVISVLTWSVTVYLQCFLPVKSQMYFMLLTEVLAVNGISSPYLRMGFVCLCMNQRIHDSSFLYIT